MSVFYFKVMSEFNIVNPQVTRISQIEDKSGSSYGIYNGEHSFYLKQLIPLCRQTRQLQAVPKDAAKRFASTEALTEWLAKSDKEIYFLLGDDKPGELGGIVWHPRQPKQLDGREYSFNFAIRIYESAEGRGLAKPFMRKALGHLALHHVDATEGIWLSTGIQNTDNVGMYTSFGYEEVTRDKTDVYMVLSPERIRDAISDNAGA